jgi:hypothetical protein
MSNTVIDKLYLEGVTIDKITRQVDFNSYAGVNTENLIDTTQVQTLVENALERSGVQDNFAGLRLQILQLQAFISQFIYPADSANIGTAQIMYQNSYAGASDEQRTGLLPEPAPAP